MAAFPASPQKERGEELEIQIDSILAAGLGTTNEIIPEPQRLQALDLLGYAESELQSLEEGMARLVLQLVVLNNKHTQHLARVQRLRTAIAPHKHLPSEILAEIFMHCLDDTGVEIKPVDPKRPGRLSMPWTLGHVCSTWRQVALADSRFWNSIYFRGTERHLAILQEVFNRSSQSRLRLCAHEYCIYYLSNSFIREVVVAQSHRIRNLSLDLSARGFCDFLGLPPGLFNAMEYAKFSVSVLQYMSAEEASVFRGNTSLQRIEITCTDDDFDMPPFPAFPLALDLPWSQLTYIGLRTTLIHLVVAHELLNRCTNLRECSLCLCDDVDSSIVGDITTSLYKVYPLASIHLPHLRKLHLHIAGQESPDLYRDCLQALVLPLLEEFSFLLLDYPPPWSPFELAALIATIPHRSTRFKLEYRGEEDIGEIIRPLGFLTSITALNVLLSRSEMQSIAQNSYVPKLMSLSTDIAIGDIDDFFNMLEARRSRLASQATEAYTGIRSGTISVVGVMGSEIMPQLHDKILAIQQHIRDSGSEIEIRLRTVNLDN